MKNQQKFLYIGLMSGTSMDGIDAVVAQFSGTTWQKSLAHAFTPYPSALKNSLLKLQNVGDNELHQSAVLAREVADLCADVVQKILLKSKLNANDIAAIGCHGQTVRHAPALGYSIQLVDGAHLAARTRIDTVTHFRQGDLAADGQGAPLAPAFHQAVFASPNEHRVILNLGGIANISILPKSGAVTGFDTGPANMLLDDVMQKFFSQAFDFNGNIAKTGRVIPELLEQLLREPYLHAPPPKSTGRDLFNRAWLTLFLSGKERKEDILRTLTLFSARSAAAAILRHAQATQAVYACGGGVKNLLLMNDLQSELGDIQLRTTGDLNVPPNEVEAAAFAWLAACNHQGCALDFRHITGAREVAILGCLWKAAHVF